MPLVNVTGCPERTQSCDHRSARLTSPSASCAASERHRDKMAIRMSVRENKAPCAASVMEVAILRRSSGASANELLTLTPIPTTNRFGALSACSIRIPETFRPSIQTSLGHFNQTPAEGRNIDSVSAMANPVTSEKRGHAIVESPNSGMSMPIENISAPSAPHQRFTPRPRPAVCRSAPTKNGVVMAGSFASAKARSLVDST